MVRSYLAFPSFRQHKLASRCLNKWFHSSVSSNFYQRLVVPQRNLLVKYLFCHGFIRFIVNIQQSHHLRLKEAIIKSTTQRKHRKKNLRGEGVRLWLRYGNVTPTSRSSPTLILPLGGPGFNKKFMHKFPVAGEISLENVWGLDSEKWHIPGSFITKSTMYCQMPRGPGEIRNQMPGGWEFLWANAQECLEKIFEAGIEQDMRVQ